MATSGMAVLQLAGFWRRFLAGLLDALVVLGAVAGVTAVWCPLLGEPLPDWNGSLFEWLVELPFVADGYLWLGLALGLSLGLGLVYYAQVLWQASPGQRVFGMKVVAPDGCPPGWARLALRTLFLAVSAGYLLLGVLWIAFDKLRQGWHDRLAGTYVVRTN